MLRIDLAPPVLANTRFAISPLITAFNSLWLIREGAQGPDHGWGHHLRTTVRDLRLVLLGSIFQGPWDYLPDFLNPQPEVYEPDLQDELHKVATVGSERLSREIALMLQGRADTRLSGGAAPRPLLQILEQGETAVAERAAAELQHLWQAAVEPAWPGLRSRIENDIARRAQTATRQGMATMLAGLHPRIAWNDDHLLLVNRYQGCVPNATSLILTPSVFATDVHFTLDPVPGQDKRQPIVAYPALPVPDSTAPTPPVHELLGVMRARLLSDLGLPRATDELAERHCLSPSTVSYHLGILHRAGLVTKTRIKHRVLYQRIHRADALLSLPA
ncbi:winged helix-turn-helix domain-containing protein [Streptomyces sp. BPTC-684]|uniref:winged helix-turn-helix domain-containing protein n=1 Tax=Streptomyces sp. BPTC-684 TaxID=3043734 RepID=UPI0024B1AB03|nr:winged helix-turn-helix domain-containing protein [Streptomyces sp. BPTC-684]WHM40682.1 winged helix-turn-helix domain-containing protein [Streptomyces sp. BPTC-684]